MKNLVIYIPLVRACEVVMGYEYSCTGKEYINIESEWKSSCKAITWKTKKEMKEYNLNG